LIATIYPIQYKQGNCGDGFVGALRLGDFKLVVFVEYSVTTPCFLSHRIFNVKLNPLEREDGNCDNQLACKSVHNLLQLHVEG
jgi:hypothetical protein